MDSAQIHQQVNDIKQFPAATVPAFINGSEVILPETFDVINPTTGSVTSRCSNASTFTASAAIKAATNALPTWSETNIETRRDILIRAATILDERAEELKDCMKSEVGADEAWSSLNVALARDCLLGTASRIGTLEGRIPALRDTAVGGMIIREPYGVIFAMAPWNAPYALGFRAIVGPIACGNTVVFKGSELSPRCLFAIVSILHEAGVPPGVLNYISCSAANAPAVTGGIIASPSIRKINFTGSTAVGRIIAKMAGEHLKPLLLELGGKAPAIICDDADLDLAAQQCVLGSFLNAGQICMSTERILVHKSIREAFETKITEAAASIFPTNQKSPVLITEHAARRNKALVHDATSKGAKLVYGNIDEAQDVPTALRPAIVADVRADMDMYLAESFGPTVSMIEFDTDEEALRLANDGEYGLSSAVFSRDLRRALRIAKRIETGAVHINRMTVQDESGLPHGGAKSSGFGRFNAGFDEWTRLKNITYDL